MFTDNIANRGWYGVTRTLGNAGGCFVFPGRIAGVAEAANFLHWLSHTAAHELTHAIIDTIDQNGFNQEEHVRDPDPTDGEFGPLDRPYLMSHNRTAADRVRIIFDPKTRGQIDLTRKDSVEV
jgi:hypothetical protein